MGSAGIDLAALLAGSRAVLARAISVLENERPGSAELSAGLAPHRGRAHVVGITGVPGAGKSTLINALLGELLGRGKRVAVLAVDPSSPVTGGAVLGDRVRMDQQGAHQNVFIRSVSARGHLGGLSRTTGRIIDLFDAAGFDLILVETVGAGQSEVEISRFADTRIVLCPPGLGDDVQAIKAGILEIADILVVSKADQAHAARTVRDLRTMLHLRRPAAWTVEVLETTAANGGGILALAEKIEQHAAAAGVGQRLKRALDDAFILDHPDGLSSTNGAPRLVIGGTGSISQAVARIAAVAGFECTVLEPSGAPLPGDSELSGSARQLAVVTLNGGPGVDPLLIDALRSHAFYIGALDSAQGHTERAQRIAAQGAEEELARLRPLRVGELAGQSPAEMAVSIVARIIDARPTPRS
jgi:LAO/AO transport system ATPase